MSRRHMLSRRRLLRSASAITAAQNRADVRGSKENAPTAEAATAKALELMAPVPVSHQAGTLGERINDLESVVDADRLRDVTTN